MKKISVVLFLIGMAVGLSSCATIKPSSTVLIYPPITAEVEEVAGEEMGDNLPMGIKKIVIEQTRLGKTTYKDSDVEVSYDSKGTGIITGLTKEILPILTLKALDD